MNCVAGLKKNPNVLSGDISLSYSAECPDLVSQLELVNQDDAKRFSGATLVKTMRGDVKKKTPNKKPSFSLRPVLLAKLLVCFPKTARKTAVVCSVTLVFVSQSVYYSLSVVLRS